MRALTAVLKVAWTQFNSLNQLDTHSCPVANLFDRTAAVAAPDSGAARSSWE